jgi:hypothetical protein
MIYINDNNIYFYMHNIITCVPNDTDYLPVCTYNNILLMSNGQLYTIARDYTLSVLKLKQEDNYVVYPTDFTDEFAKINSPGEYYGVCETFLSFWKIPIVANNSHNIKRVLYEYNGRNYFCYYYVNVNNELVVFDTLHESSQHKILDNNVNLILYNSWSGDCIIYEKNETIVFSNISNFMHLTDHYIIDYDGQSIIKSLGILC